MKEEKSDQDLYNELSLYTLQHNDPAFIHQYMVDTYAAQYADKNTKPITTAFALMGLYLHLEKNYSGKEVQKAHMQMGKKKREWPRFQFPKERGQITVADVLKAKPGISRDKMINKWSYSVWRAWSENQTKIAYWLKSELNI
jgi:hypothetical protein